MQKPFDHSLPSHAEAKAAQAAAAQGAMTAAERAARWRTAGIWIFGMMAFGMLGALFAEWLARDTHEALVGMIAGAAGFGCLRLLLAERRALSSAQPAVKR
jgi:uncharacterized membrane protein YfcA